MVVKKKKKKKHLCDKIQLQSPQKKVECQFVQENSNNLFGLKVTTERHAMPIKGISKRYCL